MFLITEGQDFETVFVEVGIKMVRYGNGIDLMAQSQELAEWKFYHLLSKVNIEASIRIGLKEGVEFRLINCAHKVQN